MGSLLSTFQGVPTCNPKGRDCIERHSKSTFNCSVNCEGIYADVQRVGEKLETDMEVDEDEVEEASKGKDWKKLKTLISEYEMFKRSNVQHFKFNATAYSKNFSKFQF